VKKQYKEESNHKDGHTELICEIQAVSTISLCFQSCGTRGILYYFSKRNIYTNTIQSESKNGIVTKWREGGNRKLKYLSLRPNNINKGQVLAAFAKLRKVTIVLCTETGTVRDFKVRVYVSSCG